MAKTKRIAKPEPVGDFTDAARSGPEWTDARVALMPGERRQALHTRLRECPAIGWARTGYLERRLANALVIYADACEEAGYGLVRSCLAQLQPGGYSGLSPAQQFEKRQRLAHMRNAVGSGPDAIAALIFVDQTLFSEQRESLDDISERMIRGNRANRRDVAKAMIVMVAEAVAGHVERGERPA